MKDKYSIYKNDNLDIVLNKLNNYQFCVVLDDNDKCLGTITDGDLRRFIMKNKLEKAYAIEICNKNFIYSFSEENIELNHDIKHLPILDINMIYQKTIKTNTYKANKSDAFVIMAGGLGTRMGDLTKNKPKPLLEIKGKTIIELIIKKIKYFGFQEIFIVINYLGEMIEDFIGTGEKFGVNIKYIRESERRGTAGSLDNDFLNDFENIIITNADLISDLNLSLLKNFHINRNNDFTMAVKQQKIKNDFGVVLTEGLTIMGLQEKPVYTNYINAGIYVIKNKIRNLIKKNEFVDMTELCLRSIKNGYKSEVYPFTEKWHDIGSKKKLYEINQARDNNIL